MRSSIYQLNRLYSYLFKSVCLNSKKLCIVSMKRHFSDWHIVGALCLERKPVITRTQTPLEEKYSQYLQKLEIEQSFLSEHEKRHLDDLKTADKLKKNELEDIDAVAAQTAQDFEDAWLEDLNKHKPAPRETEADRSDDRQSLQRKLDSSLVFVVNQKLGNDYRWILPQTICEEGETLRQTVERLLCDLFPHNIKARIMGNAPVGYYKYKYPKAHRENGICGAKVFFFKAQLLDKNLGVLNVNHSEATKESQWLTHSELGEVMQLDYGKAVQSFLFPDSVAVDSPRISQSTSSDEDEPFMKTSASN